MTFLLTKIFIKSSLQNLGKQYDLTNKKNFKTKFTFYGILIIYLIAAIGLVSYSMIENFKSINQETAFIGLIFILVIGVTLIQTIFSSINLLYFTKDTESILPLPLKPHQIIMARTNVIILMGYFINVIIGLIPLIIYGIMLDCGAWYYISVIIGLILLPVLPIIFVSLIVMLIMSFSKITKNKNRFQLLATIIVIAIVIAFSFFMTKIESKTISDEQIKQMMTQANSMINVIKGYFPTLQYAINAILSNSIVTGIFEFFKIICITVMVYALYVLLSQKLYFKGLIGSLYNGAKRKNKKVVLNKKEKTISKLYVAKEFKILFRNPVFMVQCILPAILFPILLVTLIFLGFDGNEISKIRKEAIVNESDKQMMFFLVLSAIQFFSMIIYISATAISRDGLNAVVMKYIPISLFKQYVYKTIPNIIMYMIMIVFTIGIAKYMINISILDMILVFIISTIIAVFQSFLLILMDLKRPKLQWSSEYAVVKQNINLIFAMIFAFINISIILTIISLMEKWSVYLSVATIGCVYFLATYVLLKFMKKKQYELASKII